MQQLSQRRSKQGGQSSDNDHQVDLNKPMTYREIVDMMTKTRDEGRLRKKGIMRKYPPEMDLVPYPPKYKLPTFQSYMGKSSAYQHIVHFKSRLGGIPDIDALNIRSFIGTLKGTAFDWYKQLPENSITSWAVLEKKFLLHF